MASGALAAIAVRKEATYKTNPATFNGTSDGIFGHGTKLSSISKANNVERIYGIGSRQQQVNLEKQFVGSFSVEYVLSNPWVFVPFFGKSATTGGPVYTHTMTEQNDLPSYSVQNGIELGATDARQVFLGCVNNSKSLTCNVGDPVMVRDDYVYATELFSTDTYVAQQAEDFSVYSFAFGTLGLPDGTTVANVQNCEISMANNSDIIYGIGSRVGSTHVDKQREYSIRASVYLTNPAVFWRAFYTGGATSPFSGTAPGTHTEIPTMTLTLDNGGASTAQRQIKLAFTGVMMDSYSSSQDPTAPIMEDATFFARSLTVTAIDATTTTPAAWYTE